MNLAKRDLPSGKTLVIGHSEGHPAPQVLDSEGDPIKLEMHHLSGRIALVMPD